MMKQNVEEEIISMKMSVRLLFLQIVGRSLGLSLAWFVVKLNVFGKSKVFRLDWPIRVWMKN